MKIGFFGGKFLPFHTGHLEAAKTAATLVDKLYIVLSSSRKRDKDLCIRDGIKYMPAEQRLSWIGNSLKDIRNVSIVHIKDCKGIYDYDWVDGANKIKAAIKEEINYVFSSEPSYSKYFDRLYPDAEHIVLNAQRDKVAVSSTLIRKNLNKYWDYLVPKAKTFLAKKVAIVGTESCGKTTLSGKLAVKYNTLFVEETGRKYCENYTNQLNKKLFDNIAMEHALVQEKLLPICNKILFIDSEAIITQYYLKMYLFCPFSTLINEIIKQQEYDLVLYLEPDVKWVPDGLRFAGGDAEREYNNAFLKSMFNIRKIPFSIISGDYNSRFEQAVQHIEVLLEGT